MSWCLIESDPGVFTELIREMGVEKVQVEELYSLDDASLDTVRPVYGLVFLFKWEADHVDDRVPETNDDNAIFFANQVITNACATQAILSILLNRDDVINIGPHLTEFKEFTHDFPPELKGTAIGNSDKIRDVHNSFARPDQFLMDDQKSDGQGEAFHFIAYLPINGHLYELDGLKKGPYNLGPCGTDWLSAVRPKIEERIQKYSSQEIRFSLMAVIKDRISEYTEQIASLTEQKMGQAGDTSALDCKIEELGHLIQIEEEKADKHKRENNLRKHNFIPFLINTLKVLADNGELMGLVAAAKQRWRGAPPS